MRILSSLVPLILGLVIASTSPATGQMRKIIAEFAPMAETDAVHPDGTVRAVVTVTLPKTFHMQSDAPRNPLLVATALTLQLPPGVELLETRYPPTIELKQEGVDEALAVFERDYRIGILLKLGSDLPVGPLTIPLSLRYQPCDESMCYPPTKITADWSLNVVPKSTPLNPVHADLVAGIPFGTGQGVSSTGPASVATRPDSSSGIEDGLALLDRFTIVDTAGGYLGATDFLRFIHNAEIGKKQPGMFEGHGPLAIILIVLLGGFALNLTPCVLPMVPINLAIIGAGSQSGSTRRGFLLGATYGIAMALVYGILGLVVILTAGSFGTINSSPWFNLGIAILFIVLGLAMFDVVTIDFSRWSGGINSAAKRGSFVLAFSMGAVAALLAGACVAPVVIQVVLFSSNLYADGNKSALALPFFLGLGMAIPWPIAGAGLSALPKPGAWMKHVKQVFGILIIGTALYYAYLSYELFAKRSDAPQATAVTEGGWHSSLAEGLHLAQTTRQPVIIDLWASWCKNCLTMDQTTFRNSEINAKLAGYVKIRIAAENPDEEPVKLLIRRFKVVGLPSYVILRSKPVAK